MSILNNKKPFSIEESVSGFWIFRKNTVQISGHLEEMTRVSFLQDFSKTLTFILKPILEKFSDRNIVSGYRGCGTSEVTKTHARFLLIRGELVKDEDEDEKEVKVPFEIEILSNFKNYDEEKRSLNFEFYSVCRSDISEVFLETNFFELTRNPAIRLNHIELDIEKFSLNGLLAKWSGNPLIEESFHMHISASELKISATCDANASNSFFLENLRTIFSEYDMLNT